MTVKVVAICGSLRKNSTNKGMLRYAAAHAPQGMEIAIADISQIPFYNADIKSKPGAVSELVESISACDALLFACPEYNYSLAPALKNALDWVSREPNNAVLSGKPAAIMGSAAGMGSSRAQYHLRQVCVYLNLHLLNQPEVFANAFSGAFDAEGNLIDEKIQQLINKQSSALQQLVLQLKK